ncbi:MAG: hypothetical protein ACLGQW_09805 [Acidobacteriota bacterium]
MPMFIRQIFLVTAALVVMAAQAHAQQKRDGHYWRSIPETEKIDIILGFYDGMALSEGLIQVVIRDNYTICSEVIESIMAQTARYMDNLSTMDAATGLDKFYDDPANRNIPISWGMWVVARKSKGDKNLAPFIKELRKAHK